MMKLKLSLAKQKKMYRRLQMEGFQAGISTLSNLITQAKVLNDPIGEFQLAKRKGTYSASPLES